MFYFMFYFSGNVVASSAANEPIRPIPLEIELDQRKVSLGNALFHDKRLSHDNTIACASCHDLKKGGTDRQQYSTGINSSVGGINSPTVYNTGFNFRQFWNGRAETLEQQAEGPIHNPIEMGSNWDEVINKLNKDANYPAKFKEIYGKEGIQPDSIVDAIATFERSLSTPNSRFDQYLRGNEDAITENEKHGYKLFKSYGCISCHQGVNVGGNMFQKFGVMKDYFKTRGNINKEDFGRFNVTGNEYDKFTFKVPSLRLVSLTPPYFHDGSAKTLRDAVDVMFEYQLGRSGSDEDKNSIIAFLKSLVGEMPNKGGN